MEAPFRVGLTGGVGSGKSTVATMLAELGASIVDTDAIAHAVTGQNGAAIPALAHRFGNDVINAHGALDRPAMRDKVFADPGARQDLESILHPLIRLEVQRLCALAAGIYVVIAVPLLIEHLAEYRPLMDRILVVDCSPELQVARTSARPGLDENMARAIMNAQVSRESRLAAADDVIDNEGDLPALRRQVETLHRLYAIQAANKLQGNPNNPLR